MQPTSYCPYPRRLPNYAKPLWMSLQRQHFLFSFLKTLNVGPCSRQVLHWATQSVVKDFHIKLSDKQNMLLFTLSSTQVSKTLLLLMEHNKPELVTQ